MNIVTPYVRAECPLCHTVAPTHYYVSGGWRCRQCGADWTESRLAHVAAFDELSRQQAVLSDVG